MTLPSSTPAPVSSDAYSLRPVMDATSLQLFRRLINDHVRQYAGLLVVAVAFMVVSAAMTGVMAKMMEPIIDRIFTLGEGNLLLPVSLAVMTVFTVRGFATYAHSVLLNKMGQRVIGDIQRRMFNHLIHADVGFFHAEQSGRLLARFLTDTYLIRTGIIETLIGFGKNGITLIVLLGVMFYQDFKLSLLSVIVFPAAALIVARISRKLRRFSKNAQAETGQLAAVLGQAMQGNKHVKAYGMEAFEKQRIGRVVERIFDVMYKSFKVSGRATPVTEILSGVTIVAIIVYGGNQVVTGESTAGKLFSFITAFMLAYEPMKRLARLNNTVQMGLAAVERMYLLLDHKPVIEDRPGATDLETTSPEIVFENVVFDYPDGTRALDHFSMRVPAGKMVALVGASGSGKSTLLNLLPRFYDVTSGRILVDGRDIRDLKLKSLRQHMAFVSQEIALFNDTVFDNIRYGTPEATEEQVVEAARAAAAHAFIEKLPQGYQTLVGEAGVKLSGGQRQRLSIARAFLRNAPILLLDEATSALDSQSEKLVQQAIDRLQKGKTTLIVAHRLSTIIGADLIYVVDQGRVVEEGTHETLLAKGGAYARLYGQMERDEAEVERTHQHDAP